MYESGLRIGLLTSDDSSHFKASFRKIIISRNCKPRVVNRIIGQFCELIVGILQCLLLIIIN